MPEASRAALALLLAVCPLGACGGDDGGERPLEPTYENVEMIVARSCAFGSTCHGGVTGQAELNFETFLDAGEPITMAFENPDGSPRPSCEYDLMPVVDPGNPDNSWLLVKLEGEVGPDGSLAFEPDPSWMPDTSDPDCPRIEMGAITFGIPMPFSAGEPTPLPDRELEMIREWIALGAPGPE